MSCYGGKNATDETAFPAHRESTDGMSYREWLIGQAIGGVCHYTTSDDEGDGIVDLAFRLADKVIARLKAEAEGAKGSQ